MHGARATWLARRSGALALGALLGAVACGQAPASTDPAMPAPTESAAGALGGAAGSGAVPAVAAPAGAAPFEEPYFPFFDDEPADVSVSVGSSARGLLVNARAVAEDATLGILPRQKARDLGWGTAEMVELLTDAAGSFHAATGARLWIGDVARRGGGDIAWSVSHNTGRDADVAFAYTDARGKPVDPPDLVPLNDQGVSPAQGLKLDAARTWILVKALAGHPRVAVQYLFVAPSLKRKILLQAKQAGDPPALVERAAAMLWPQAGHADHLHVRIYCSARDVEGGCRNEGVVQPWADLHEDAARRREAQAVAQLEASDATARRRGIERLELLGSRPQAGRVAARLDDEDLAVRAAAARALGTLGGADEAPRLVARFAEEPSDEVALALLGAIAAIGGDTAGSFFRDAIAAQSPLSLRAAAPGLAWLASTPGGLAWGLGALLPYAVPELPAPLTWLEPAARARDERVWPTLLEAAGRSERLEPVPVLVPLVAAEDGGTRTSAGQALARLANRSFGGGGDDGDPRVRARTLAEWQTWVKRQRGQPRGAWLCAGFQAAGYRIGELHQKNLWELVRAASGPDFLSFNAQRVLAVLTQRPDAAVLAPAAACRDWLRWLSARRDDFRLGRPPEHVLASCR
ncbi:MAG: penicillin-insensitive murein endopeptidase [Myxococcales bacterium]|nr:penicillin-insensitive murein endopeptidase [Myxococcales bacterium]